MAAIELIEISGARLWTARQGNGPALVCCHGGPGLWDHLGPVAEMVDDLATVYRYDQRACGRSSGSPPFDVATAVADLEALRAHWGVPRWIVLGHSWGATLALAYCLAHPDRAAGLVYLAGTGVDPAWHAEYRANRSSRLSPEDRRQLEQAKRLRVEASGEESLAADRLYCELAWSTDFAVRERSRELARSLFVEDLRPNYEVNRVLGEDADRFAESGDLPRRLQGMRLPTLVVHGEADPRPAWAARRVADLIRGSELALVPRAGHLPWLEQPEVVREKLRGFIEDCVGATARPYSASREGKSRIRIATATDVPRLVELQLTWVKEDNTYGFTPADQSQVRSALGPFLLVAEVSGEVVGFVSGSRHVCDGTAVIPVGTGYLEIDDLYVAPLHRGRGIGRSLVDRAVEEARSQGLRHVSVYSAVKDLRRVMDFYESAGFRSWFVRMFREI